MNNVEKWDWLIENMHEKSATYRNSDKYQGGPVKMLFRASAFHRSYTVEGSSRWTEVGGCLNNISIFKNKVGFRHNFPRLGWIDYVLVQEKERELCCPF